MADNVHHRTKKGADLALAKRQISPDSHKAVHEGRIGLDEAKELGREGSPFGPAPKAVSKNDRSRLCLCGCQQYSKGGLFAQGHDMRMFRIAREHLQEGRDLSEEQREYLDQSGKMERVKARLAEEERKASERAAAREAKAKK